MSNTENKIYETLSENYFNTESAIVDNETSISTRVENDQFHYFNIFTQKDFPQEEYSRLPQYASSTQNTIDLVMKDMETLEAETSLVNKSQSKERKQIIWLGNQVSTLRNKAQFMAKLIYLYEAECCNQKCTKSLLVDNDEECFLCMREKWLDMLLCPKNH